MTIRSLLAIALFTVPGGVARAQAVADSTAILATSRAYIDAIWESDSVRLRRVLHPDLVKRQVLAGRNGTPDQLSNRNAQQVVTDHGQSGEPPPPNRKGDIRILHIFGNMATVAIDAGMWVDYVHLAKWNGEYRIFNIMFDFRRGT